MRSLFLITSTNEVLKYAQSLDALHLGQVSTLVYDDPALSDEAFVSKVRDSKPDFIAYIGARWGKQPAPVTLAKINSTIAPMVHICSDAADVPWWDLLRAYHEGGSFALQVAIDGSHKWPTAESNMTALTPVDPNLYPAHPMPHAQRNHHCGYAGNPGSGPGSHRTAMLTALLEKQAIDALHIRTNLPHTYEMCIKFLGSVRVSLSMAWTGTEQSMHVKGRILESALAGACVLDNKGSPTSRWFTPGVDYLEYESAAHAIELIEYLGNNPIECEAIALRLRAQVLANHTPHHFWHRIFERLGIKTAISPLAEAPA